MIEVTRKHRIVCDVCGPLYDETGPAEEAEEFARYHLNEDIGADDPRPHLEHVITITPITIVENW